MDNKLKALSLSYRQTPIEVREQISFQEQDCKELMLKLKEVAGVSEALLLSTCNRTELYYIAEEPLTAELVGLMAVQKGMPVSGVARYFEVINDSSQAVKHLYRVAMGLDSQVIGDLQISNQVKKAYQWSADTNMAGPFLHRLLHSIFFTNKRVVQETSFRDGAASVSYAAVEMVKEFLQGIHEPRVLIVGLGEIGTDVLRNFHHANVQDVTICNRTFSKAEAFATEYGFKLLPYDQLWEGVQQADLIISSVNAPQPVFTLEAISKLSIFSFKYFLDLSVPRSVAADAEKIPGVLVYDVDKINHRTSEAIQKRKAAIPQVELLIEESIAEFENWAQEMVFSPTIQKFKNALEEIRKEELARYMKKMDDASFQTVDKITKGIMNKIIKMPVMQLKAACKRGEVETLVDVLNDLFNLEKETVDQKERS